MDYGRATILYSLVFCHLRTPTSPSPANNPHHHTHRKTKPCVTYPFPSLPVALACPFLLICPSLLSNVQLYQRCAVVQSPAISPHNTPKHNHPPPMLSGGERGVGADQGSKQGTRHHKEENNADAFCFFVQRLLYILSAHACSTNPHHPYGSKQISSYFCTTLGDACKL